jgi:hypothetical protein
MGMGVGVMLILVLGFGCAGRLDEGAGKVSLWYGGEMLPPKMWMALSSAEDTILALSSL